MTTTTYRRPTFRHPGGADWIAHRFTPNGNGGGSWSVAARLFRKGDGWIAAPPGTETLRDAEWDDRSQFGRTRDDAVSFMVDHRNEN